ncbi:MAG: hypothetical protein LC114_06150, partial [Bryobacterales bacterium]|nr:hypothetical protein [Bryobacterales bacterium]
VWSSLIGQAFLEAHETLGERRYLDTASRVCDWILELPRERTPSGFCLSYVAFKQSSIHNSNMLGAALLARVGKLANRPECLEVAREAMLYSCSRQNSDGAWYYGEDPKYHWIDNFHTAYNLDSLKRYQESSGDESFRPQIEKGYEYFKRVFFEPNGRPRYYHDRPYPIDIQCASQAIDTLALFADWDSAALEMAGRVAEWTLTHMQGADGHFYYRKYPLLTARTPYFHWGQSTMFKALAHLLLVRGRNGEGERSEG